MLSHLTRGLFSIKHVVLSFVLWDARHNFCWLSSYLSMTPHLPQRHLNIWEWLLLLGGLSLFASQALFASSLKSAAFDEQYHIAAGYAYLRTGDFRLSLSHPPLVNALSGLPLLARDDVVLPVEHPSWAQSDYFIFADVFLWQANSDPQGILVHGRVPIILLGTALTALLFWWARQMISPTAGWIAFALAIFDPNLLANSRLITTDLGLTFFLTLAMWRLWRWQQQPSWRNAAWVGVAVGCAMGTKFTGLMVWPMLLGVVLLAESRPRPWRNLLGMGLVMAVVAYATLWAIYRLDVGVIPGAVWPLSHLPIPAPFYPYSLWDTFMVIEEEPKTAFLLGQISNRGWWYYFPVALLLKTPLPLLLLAGGGLWLIGRGKAWRNTAVLWLPPLLFMFLAMTGRITIGYRHILPVVPFLIMLAAQVGQGDWLRPWRGWRWRPLLVALLLLWQAFGTLSLWPHQEAFFNELAGGPAHGRYLLVDANVDWGQDLILLERLLREREINELYLGYFGTAVPEKYGITYHPTPGFLRFTAGAEIDAYNPYTPLPGWYALSMTSLQLGLMLQNNDMYAYFLGKEPVACAGYSICLYQVAYPPEWPIDRRVISDGRAVSDISPAELGVQPERQLLTKWVQSPSQIYPLGEGFVPPVDFVPLHVPFGESLTLVGYTLSPTWRVSLYWQVGDTAVLPRPHPSQAPPLATFLHLSGDDPSQIIAQYDGWPTALTGLEPGDIIQQEIQLHLPATTPAGQQYLRLGLYSPQTGQRFPLSTTPPTDMFTLTPVTLP